MHSATARTWRRYIVTFDAASSGRANTAAPINQARIFGRADGSSFLAGSNRRKLSSSLQVATAPAAGQYNHRLGRSRLVFGSHVAAALRNNEPIVALESAVITHGMPAPHNLTLAKRLESTVRAQNVTPATIGVVKGQLVVGLSGDQIEYLANAAAAADNNVPDFQPYQGLVKVSRRDLPIVSALKLSGGTTVAATLAIACQANVEYNNKNNSYSSIKVFATGGTGGVHLGGQLSLDVSADLYELARSPLAVVSAGFKAFLDTRRSLEVLETLGVTVLSLEAGGGCGSGNNDSSGNKQMYYRADDLDVDNDTIFPGFYFRRNLQLVRSPRIVRNISDASKVLDECLNESRIGCNIGGGGLLLAVPIPTHSALDSNVKAELSKQLEIVCAQVDADKSVHGSSKTPLILNKLNLLSKGKALEANIALLENNAQIGAQLAALCCLSANEQRPNFRAPTAVPTPNQTTQEQPKASSATLAAEALKEDNTNNQPNNNENNRNNNKNATPIVVGATMVDMHVRTAVDTSFKKLAHAKTGATFEGEPSLSVGGVGRNLAAALHLLDQKPRLITWLGSDSLGQFARSDFERNLRFTADQLKLMPNNSISGLCEYVIANLDGVKQLTPQFVDTHLRAELVKGAQIVVSDANLSANTLKTIVELCYAYKTPLFIEPTDVLAVPQFVECINSFKDNNNNDSEAVKLNALFCLSPNLFELRAMVAQFDNKHKNANDYLKIDENNNKQNTVKEAKKLAQKLMTQHIPNLTCLLVTLDRSGVLVCYKRLQCHNQQDTDIDIEKASINLSNLVETTTDKNSRDERVADQIVFKHIEPPFVVDKPVSGSGAGDSFAAGFIAGLVTHESLGACLRRAFAAAQVALESREAIARELCKLSDTKDSN